MEFDSQVFSLGLSPIFGSHGHQPIPSTDAVFQGTQWLAVGLESSEVEVVAIGPDGPPVVSSAGGSGNGASPALKTSGSPITATATSSPQVIASSFVAGYDQHFRLTRHESCVLALRFAHHADWFVTTGKDHQVNAWKTPYGACLLEVNPISIAFFLQTSVNLCFWASSRWHGHRNILECTNVICVAII